MKWAQYNPMRKTNLPKHVKYTSDHALNWSGWNKDPTNKKWKEAHYIVLYKPTLNENPDRNNKKLFQTGVKLWYYNIIFEFHTFFNFNVL